MRPGKLLSFFALAAWLPASAFAVTWGIYNPSSGTITATEAGRTLTVQVPIPGGGSLGTYEGFLGGYHRYTKNNTQYRLGLEIDGPSLFISLDSPAVVNPWSHVAAARVSTPGSWRRVDVSQYGMANGHAFSQKATYLDSEDLWVWAFWQPEESQGTFWAWNSQAYNANSGAGSLRLVPNMLYNTDLGGGREPLRERLEVRVGSELWDAVPSFPASRVSPWAADMAKTVFVDVWSHDNAAELAHFLQLIQQVAGPQRKLFTNWASWGTGGHDAFLPDALWLGHNPPYPPNHLGFGSLESMRALGDLGDATGWLSFRTFYSQVREAGPSYQAGLVDKILDADGSESAFRFSKRGDLPAIYQRQEPEIQGYLGPSGTFTDTLCAGYPFSYRDYDAAVPQGLAMDVSVQQDRTMADFLELQHAGPVSCESLNNEVLLGTWIATGEYDMRNGLDRLMTPEYKLRRLHGLTTFHGMGQNYRFTNIASLWGRDRYGWRGQDQLDAYRTVQMLFGNGAYLYVENNLEDSIWSHVLTELLLVGALQEHFALEPVTSIEYEIGGSAPGTWVTLEELVENQGFVMKTNPGRSFHDGVITDLPQSPEFERIRVTYANGLKVLVNRGASNFTVNAGGQSVVVPPEGWVAWGTIGGDSVLAYSAFAPGTAERIDYLEDLAQGVRYVDPRGGTHHGVTRPTQWVRRDGVWRVRLEAELEGARPAVMVDGRRLPMSPPGELAAPALNADFTRGLEGWRTIRGIRQPQLGPDGLELEVAAEFSLLHSPRLRLAAGAADVVEVDLRFDAPTGGLSRLALLFKRDHDPAFEGSRSVVVDFQITGGWQTISLPVGNHPSWAGSTIKALRLDPGKAGLPAPPFDVTLGAVRWVPGS